MKRHLIRVGIVILAMLVLKLLVRGQDSAVGWKPMDWELMSATDQLFSAMISGCVWGPLVGIFLARCTSFRTQQPLRPVLAINEIRRG
jgi:hypothetical protein